MRLLALPFFILISIFSKHALADNDFPNLLFLKEGMQSPKAELSDVAWLAGHWRGEAFGGIVEEVWSSPLGNSMMGAFKLVSDNKVVFYEIETISVVGDSLIFRLKHFNSDLTGWEDKDKSVDFKLVKVTPNKIFFDGLTLEKVNRKEMNMYVAIEHEGKTSEEKFAYKRVRK